VANGSFFTYFDTIGLRCRPPNRTSLTKTDCEL